MLILAVLSICVGHYFLIKYLVNRCRLISINLDHNNGVSFMSIIFSTFLFSIVWIFSINSFASGDPVIGESKAFQCETCHSKENLQMNPIWPFISGQNKEYLSKQILDYQSGERKHGVMQQMVSKLNGLDISDITKFYSEQPVTVNSKQNSINSAGKMIYESGVVSSGANACVDCHGADGKSNAAGGFVTLSGQQKVYIKNQLYAFKYGDRTNDLNGLMQKSVEHMSDKEIENVSEYISSLKF